MVQPSEAARTMGMRLQRQRAASGVQAHDAMAARNFELGAVLARSECGLRSAVQLAHLNTIYNYFFVSCRQNKREHDRKKHVPLHPMSGHALHNKSESPPSHAVFGFLMSAVAR